MKILSIDTSSNLCAVAVLEDSNLIKENILNDTKNHSEKIMPVIAQTLEEANLKLSDINLIVCDKGPGSFTGIRIGVATVMSFVDSLNLQSIGISSLEALMYNELLNNSKASFICSLIDAKNQNVYFKDSKYSLMAFASSAASVNTSRTMGRSACCVSKVTTPTCISSMLVALR